MGLVVCLLTFWNSNVNVLFAQQNIPADGVIMKTIRAYYR